MSRLARKGAIVTGAGRGIGTAIARKFRQEGARLLICDLAADRLEGAAHDLGPLGEVHALAGDVTDPEFDALLVRRARELFGELDVLVNNAGIVAFEPFLEHTEATWDRTLAVNLKSVFLLDQAAARTMSKQTTGGAIGNTAS